MSKMWFVLKKSPEQYGNTEFVSAIVTCHEERTSHYRWRYRGIKHNLSSYTDGVESALNFYYREHPEEIKNLRVVDKLSGDLFTLLPMRMKPKRFEFFKDEIVKNLKNLE